MFFAHFARDLFKRLPEWDSSAKLSFILAVILLVLLLFLAFAGPDEIKWLARFGAFGLLLTLQLLIFWGNRRAISPYHAAQRHYMNGEYARARDLLAPALDARRVSVDALALLGNCYRQLGQFAHAEQAIAQALQIKPDYHYALYAAGKLNLVLGDYRRALQTIERAYAQGAPPVVNFDLGQACFYLGERPKAVAYLAAYCELPMDEPAKSLLAAHYLHVLENAQPPPPEALRECIAYWQAEAARYRLTPYGTAIMNEVESLQRSHQDH